MDLELLSLFYNRKKYKRKKQRKVRKEFEHKSHELNRIRNDKVRRMSESGMRETSRRGAECMKIVKPIHNQFLIPTIEGRAAGKATPG